MEATILIMSSSERSTFSARSRRSFSSSSLNISGWARDITVLTMIRPSSFSELFRFCSLIRSRAVAIMADTSESSRFIVFLPGELGVRRFGPTPRTPIWVLLRRHSCLAEGSAVVLGRRLLRGGSEHFRLHISDVDAARTSSAIRDLRQLQRCLSLLLHESHDLRLQRLVASRDRRHAILSAHGAGVQDLTHDAAHLGHGGRCRASLAELDHDLSHAGGLLLGRVASDVSGRGGDGRSNGGVGHNQPFLCD